MNPADVLKRIKTEKHTFKLESEEFGEMVLELRPVKAKDQIEAAGGIAPFGKWKRYIGDGTKQQIKTEDEVLDEMEAMPDKVQNAMTVSERLGSVFFVKGITNISIVFDDETPPDDGFTVSDFVSLVTQAYGQSQLEALAQKIASISGLAGGQQDDQSKSGRGSGKEDTADGLRNIEDLPDATPPVN